MDQFVWVFGVLWPALVLSVLSLATLFDEETRVVLSLIAMVFWFVFSLQGGNVTVVDNGTEFAETYVSMMVLGVVMGAVMAIFVFMHVLKLFGASIGGRF